MTIDARRDRELRESDRARRITRILIPWSLLVIKIVVTGFGQGTEREWREVVSRRDGCLRISSTYRTNESRTPSASIARPNRRLSRRQLHVAGGRECTVRSLAVVICRWRRKAIVIRSG